MKRFKTSGFIYLAIALLSTACGDSNPSRGDDGDAGGEDIRDITMAGTEAGGSDDTSETPTAGTMALETAGVAVPGGTDNPPVDACSEICSKYDACGKSDIGPSGSAENCMIACRTLESLPSFEDYRTCVDSKGCDDLGDCPIPSSTVAVTCADVCEALSNEACMGDRRVPAGLPQVDSCQTACEFVAIERQVITCGEDMVRNPETCDEETFAWCLIDAQNTNCAQICDRKSQCREGVDRIDCALECINAEYDAMQSQDRPDPVSQRRAQEERSCILNAGSCSDYDTCLAPKGKQVDDAAVNALCEADADCGFLPSDEACRPAAATLLRATEDSAGPCLIDHFENQCASSPLNCMAPYIPTQEVCSEYCQVAGQCEALPDGQTRNECESTCQSAVEARDLARLAPFRQGLSCAYAASCADFTACLDGADEYGCDALCERRADCMTPAADTCPDTCPSRTGTLRNWAERTCTQAAGQCDGVNRCVAEPAPPCDRLCAQRGAVCGDAPAGCETACDDDDFLNPGAFSPTYACLAVTTDCDERTQCNGESTSGLACLNWCREAQGCSDDPSGLLDCVDRCASGFEGYDAIKFFNAETCLRDAGLDAVCADLSACVSEVDVADTCVAYCETLGPEQCAIIDGEGCVGRCTMAMQLHQNGGLTPDNHDIGGLSVGGAHGGHAAGTMAGAGGDEQLGGGFDTAGSASAGGTMTGGSQTGGSASQGGFALGGTASGGRAAGGAEAGGMLAGGVTSGGDVSAGAVSGGQSAAAGLETAGSIAEGGEISGGSPTGGASAPGPITHLPSIDGIGCVLGAKQRNLGCLAIAECIGAVEADENGCPEETTICLPAPSATCAEYCVAKAGCDASLDTFQCRRLCTPEPAGLGVKATCAGLVAGCTGAEGCARWPGCLSDGQLPLMCDAQQQCDLLEACEGADAEIPEQCSAACQQVNACGDGALFGEGENAVAPSLEQCQIDCAAQSIIDANGSDVYLNGLEGCLNEANPECEGPVERACLHGAPLVDCRAAAMALGDCVGGQLALLGFPASVDAYVMSCEELARMDADAAENQVECIIDASMNAGQGAGVPIPGLGNLLECISFVQCFGVGGGGIPGFPP